MKLIIFFLMMGLVSSCSMSKMMNRNPTEAANECALRFPCTDSVVKADTQFVLQTDTLWGLSTPDTVTVECPPATKLSSVKAVCPPAKTYTITKRINTVITIRTKVTDKAKEAVLIRTQVDLANAEKGRSWWKTACLITWGILLLLGGYTVVKLIKP